MSICVRLLSRNVNCPNYQVFYCNLGGTNTAFQTLHLSHEDEKFLFKILGVKRRGIYKLSKLVDNLYANGLTLSLANIDKAIHNSLYVYLS